MMQLERPPQLLVQTFFGAVILKLIGLCAAIIFSYILVQVGNEYRWWMAFATNFVLIFLLIPLVFFHESLSIVATHRRLKVALTFAIFAPYLDLIQSSWASIDMDLLAQVGWTSEQVHNVHALGILFIIAPVVLSSWQYGRRGFYFTLILAGCLYVLLPFVIPADTFTFVLYAVRGFVLLGMALILGATIGSLASAQRREQKALEVANKQLAKQTILIEQLATSRERNRLARELHDTLAHSLSATAVQLQAVQTLMDVDSKIAKNELRAAQKQIKDGLKESRRAIESLRASPLEELGFVFAVKQRAFTIGERAGARVRWQADSVWPALSPLIEQSLYRIMDEALLNAEKHAQAKTFDVCLMVEGEQLRLTIADDGIGFVPEGQGGNGRFGLIGMQERADLIGATLIISSVLQEGTKIELCLIR